MSTWTPQEYDTEAKMFIYVYGKENCWGEFIDEYMTTWKKDDRFAPDSDLLLAAIKKELNL